MIAEGDSPHSHRARWHDKERDSCKTSFSSLPSFNSVKLTLHSHLQHFILTLNISFSPFNTSFSPWTFHSHLEHFTLTCESVAGLNPVPLLGGETSQTVCGRYVGSGLDHIDVYLKACISRLAARQREEAPIRAATISEASTSTSSSTSSTSSSFPVLPTCAGVSVQTPGLWWSTILRTRVWWKLCEWLRPAAQFRWLQRWANAWWKEEVQSETFNRFSISPDKFYFLTLQLRESRFQGQKVIVWATPECCSRSPPYK